MRLSIFVKLELSMNVNKYPGNTDISHTCITMQTMNQTTYASVYLQYFHRVIILHVANIPVSEI